MISIPEIVIERIAVEDISGASFLDASIRVAKKVRGEECGGVIAATFSNPERFPALSIRVAGALGLAKNIPAFDIQLACSAYPYALYMAGKLSKDFGKSILVIDGDKQSDFVDKEDHATGKIFSDKVTATVVSVNDKASSQFDFLSLTSDDLTCLSQGPIKMNGFKVFSFVATEVSDFLRQFDSDFDYFAPHQANPYMIRQLARSLKLTNKVLTISDQELNPGSCSVAVALAKGAKPSSRVLIAGFGAGYSASAGIVKMSNTFVAEV